MVRLVVFLLVLVPEIVFAQFYNGSNQEFGKNRVQYYEFDWNSQNFERFKVYFYRGGDELAEYTARTVQKELYALEDRLNYNVTEHLDILLFKSLAELRQSNLGLHNEGYADYGGDAQIVGNKMLLYFEGDHLKFQQQIRKAIAELLLRNILFGDQWSDVLIASDPTKHPAWFIYGLVDYLALPLDADFESAIKDGFLTGRFDDFSKLKEEELRVAGRAFWYFIEETYGRNQLLNILYLTKISGHIDRSLLYVLGADMRALRPDFSNYYKKRFISDLSWQEDPKGEDVEIKLRRNQTLGSYAISHSGEYLAYVKNEEGKYWVFVKNQVTGDKKRIDKFEHKLLRIQDPQIPVLTFHPSLDLLVYITEHKGKLKLFLYDLNDGELIEKELPDLDKVISCSYAKDGKRMVFSGVKNGQTDIYIYSMAGNSLQNVTDDYWDDKDPIWFNDDKEILFSSNRKNGDIKTETISLPKKTTFDLYSAKVKDIKKSRRSLEQVTSSPLYNELSPKALGNKEYLFLSDENGVWNLHALKIDSTVSFIDTIVHYRYLESKLPTTNFNTSIDKFIISGDNSVLLNYRQNNVESLKDIKLNYNLAPLTNSYFQRKKELISGPRGNDSIPEEVIKEVENSRPSQVFTSKDSTYEREVLVLFQNEEEFLNQNNLKNERFLYERPRKDKYKVNYAKDFISAKIENSFFNQSYQRYTGPGSVYLNPSISGLLTISFSDVMEDFVFTGGMRIPTSRNSSEFYTSFDMRRKRLDKQFLYYRRSYENQIKKGVDKVITHELQFNTTYPFSEVWSLRSSLTSRIDFSHALALNETALLTPTRYNYQGGAKTALVFDNSRMYNENIWSGTKFKIFAEFLQDVESKSIGMINLGLDFRHSIELFKKAIWVNRFATATSLGGTRLLYYMGGVDNWALRPLESYNREIEVDPNGKFAFQTLATPMRGFIQNQRNGNSFAVFNSELRLPLFSMLSRNPIKNEPLRSFQLVGFFDLGSAWTGKHPFSVDNYFNVQLIKNKPALIKIINGREPIIAASGFGVRSKIFGYFVRLDLGWGIENGQILKSPNLFISMTHDI